jgi:hypothetical protein
VEGIDTGRMTKQLKNFEKLVAENFVDTNDVMEGIVIKSLTAMRLLILMQSQKVLSLLTNSVTTQTLEVGETKSRSTC